MNNEHPLKAPVLLEEFHSVDGFDCDVEALNTYLKKFALANNKNSSAKTYVATRDNQVVGYYTIAAGSVAQEEAPERIRKGLAKHPIPVILLARLAVDKAEQSTGIGKGLLKDSLLKIVGAADIIGARAVAVHAKDTRAQSFYEHFGFESSPIDPFHLYLLLKDIKKTLGV